LKLAAPRLLFSRFPRRAVARFISFRASRICCYHNRRVSPDGVGLELNNNHSNNNKKGDREERVAAAEMAPKQATLGYVKSGQMTLGWVITAAKILA
jgi:hypothetical protein